MSTSEVAATVSKLLRDLLSKQQTFSHEPQLESPFPYGILSCQGIQMFRRRWGTGVEKMPDFYKDMPSLGGGSLGTTLGLMLESVLDKILMRKWGRQSWLEGGADPQCSSH